MAGPLWTSSLIRPRRQSASQYGGWITATAGDTVVRTAVGAYQEPEKYDLTLTVLGRDGRPATNGEVFGINRANMQPFGVQVGPDGTVRLRLDAGHLAFATTVYQFSGDDVVSTAGISTPDLDLHANTSLTIDAAKDAQPSVITVDQPGAQQLSQMLGWHLTGMPIGLYLAQLVGGGAALYSGSVGKPAADFQLGLESTFAEPEAVVTGIGSGGSRVVLSYAVNSPRATTKGTRQLVSGGTGTPADLSKAEVKGRVVLVAPAGNDPAVIAADVAKAGGVGMIEVGRLFSVPNDTPIPVYEAGTEADSQLLLDAVAHGPTTVSLTTVASSPYQYDLFYPISGAFPVGGLRHETKSQLAHIKAKFRAAGVSYGYTFIAGDFNGFFSNIEIPVGLPSTQDQYLSPRVSWLVGGMIGSYFDQTNWFSARQSLPAQAFRAGRAVEQSWNGAVFSPRVSTAPVFTTDPPYAYRSGDTLGFGIPLRVDSSADHSDYTCYLGMGSNQLLRNGTPVTTGPGASPCPGGGEWTVPADDAAYEFKAQMASDAPASTFSSRVSATWDFRSAHVAGNANQPLPLLDVGYSPPADDYNRVPVNAVVPISVGRQRGSAAARVSSVQAWASFDDGKTWSLVRAVGAGDTWVLPVLGGKSGGFVSLRVKATDTAGNSVDETMVHAYQLR